MSTSGPTLAVLPFLAFWRARVALAWAASSSAYFVVTIMYVYGNENRKKIKFAVRRTLKKLNSRKGKKRIVEELKGTDTTIEVKKYFYGQLKDVEFEEIYLK